MRDARVDRLHRRRLNAGGLALDPAGQHVLDGDRLHSADPRSPLAGALAAHLRIDGATAWLGDAEIARRGSDGWRARVQLTPLELRFLADRGRPHPARDLPALPAPRTDLHTHFAGCVRGADLVRIGAAHGVVIPAALLRRAGMHGGDLPLADAPGPVRARYAAALGLPIDAQCTHHDMNRVYDLRRPITKHPGAFVDLCGQIARDYAAMGVVYAELSLFDVLEPGRLALADAALPAIRAETGVDLRFLAALSRHDDLEWDLDMLRRLEALAGSPSIVGIDIMGHETNSTRAIAPHLRAIGAFVRACRPDFAVRVHAGENPAFPENVRVAVETLAALDVTPRIGHGVYGTDDETLALLRDRRAIVEFNLDSNFALNNVRDALEVPLARYAAAGVPVVLGTDGYGIYGGDARHQARAAALAGLDDPEVVPRAEAAVLAAREAADAALTTRPVPREPVAPVHYTPEITSRNHAAHARALARLAEVAGELVPLSALDARWPGARHVALCGSWRHHLARLDGADRARIESFLDAFVDGLAARGALLLTGGTTEGVEGLAHARARRLGVPVVGVLVDESPVDALDQLDAAVHVGRKLWDKAAALFPRLAEHGGAAVFVGGGQIANDELRAAANLRVRRAWMAGVPGASGDAARRWPEHAFVDAAGALARIDGARPAGGLWRDGPNPCADLVCTRAVGAGVELLLVRRAPTADAEPGRWALPGGFLEPDEAPEAGALRVLAIEAALDARWLRDRLVPLGVRERGGRDPRDTDTRWVRSHAFRLDLPTPLAALTLVAGHDTSDVCWWPVDALPPLAFDHARIAADALTRAG